MIARYLTAVLTVLANSAGSGADPELPVFTDVTDQAGIHFRHCYGDP